MGKIITIGRQLGSGGRLIGKLLAEKLGYKFYDKDIIAEIAKENGLETAAKVQINNSWENSSAPFIPVYDNVVQHMKNLTEVGVDHIMLTWTLGGYISDSIKMASAYFFEDENSDKQNYCLFIAPRLHQDTVNTFYNSVKYEYEGEKQKIIPMTISQLINILQTIKLMIINNRKFHRINASIFFRQNIRIC